MTMKPLSAIFIGGFPKSGTTLLATLLDGHPELMVFPEETSVLAIRHNVRTLKSKKKFIRTRSGARVPGLPAEENVFKSGVRDYSWIPDQEYSTGLRKALSPAKNDRELLEAILKNWIEFDPKRDRNNWKYFVEKTPLNELYYRKILAWYPEAKFLYIIRDPRDNLLSYSKKKMARRPIPLLIERWKQSYHTAKLLESKGIIHIIRYRDLVSDPIKEMKKVAAFLHIEFHSCLIRPTRGGIPWEGNSMFGDNAKVVHGRSKGRYKEVMDKQLIHYIEYMLYPEMQALGYSISYATRIKKWLESRGFIQAQEPLLPVPYIGYDPNNIAVEEAEGAAMSVTSGLANLSGDLPRELRAES
ncbi:MAG: sulfotransferase [Rickettsiales bacterium]|nr:sulfotransferase [Rickettsiales bacterium]